MVKEVKKIDTTPTLGNSKPQKQQNIQKLNQQRMVMYKPIVGSMIQKGSIVSFNYLFWKHDPYPFIICSGQYNGKVWGVNLHYLTMGYVKYLISMYCGKQFSYQLIKADRMINNSYRSYKNEGIRQPKVFDCQFLNSILGSIKSLNPTEIEAIRREVEKQLRQKMQQTTADLINEGN